MAKYSKAAQKSVGSAMKRMEKGKLRSGNSNKKVTNPKQAIAIGLSEAKQKGAKVPAKKATSKSATKKAVKKTVPKKAPLKKAIAKKAIPKKAAPKKAITKKAPAGKELKKRAPAKKMPAQAVPKKTAPKKVAVKNTVPENKTDEGKLPGEIEKMNQDLVNNDARDAINQMPVEEKSPVIPNAKPEDPILAVDKKELKKLTTRVDLKHNKVHFSKSKGNIKPGGKKPLWN